MMISCADCKHFNLRDAGQMARLGCGRCAFDKPATTYPALRLRECGKFEAADEAITAKRRQWLNANAERARAKWSK